MQKVRLFTKSAEYMNPEDEEQDLRHDVNYLRFLLESGLSEEEIKEIAKDKNPKLEVCFSEDTFLASQCRRRWSEASTCIDVSCTGRPPTAEAAVGRRRLDRLPPSTHQGWGIWNDSMPRYLNLSALFPSIGDLIAARRAPVVWLEVPAGYHETVPLDRNCTAPRAVGVPLRAPRDVPDVGVVEARLFGYRMMPHQQVVGGRGEVEQLVVGVEPCELDRDVRP